MNTDMGADLIAAHRDLAALMPQLHLPVQSGSDRILAVMNRRHTRADYLDVIARLRDARPDMAFTSDFIVGYPGETEEDFRATLSIINEVGYAGAFSFKYSPRPGTPAADLEQLPEAVKGERLQRLAETLGQAAATLAEEQPVILSHAQLATDRKPRRMIECSRAIQLARQKGGSRQIRAIRQER